MSVVFDKISAGNLYGVVSFYKLNVSNDFAGGTNGVYSLIFTTRANVNSMTGKNKLEQGQKEILDIIRFTIRYRWDIAIDSRLLLIYNGLPYSIYSVSDTSNQRKELTIFATAKIGLNSIPLDNGQNMDFTTQFNTKFG